MEAPNHGTFPFFLIPHPRACLEEVGVGKERETSTGCLDPATQVCALTWSWTGSLLVPGMELNHLSHLARRHFSFLWLHLDFTGKKGKRRFSFFAYFYYWLSYFLDIHLWADSLPQDNLPKLTALLAWEMAMFSEEYYVTEEKSCWKVKVVKQVHVLAINLPGCSKWDNKLH